MVRRLTDSVSEVELRLEELAVDGSGHVAWSEVFGAARPLRVEVGVGNSPFLIEVCRSAPDYNYVGFEYCRKRVLKFAKKVVGAEIANIRILRLEATNALERLFPATSVDHFYVNHPDPWPKRRHAKHRFVQPHTVSNLARLLIPGGGVSLRTDAAAYARQMLEVLDAEETLENTAGAGNFSSAPLEPFETPYETKFREQGLPIYYLEYRKPTAAC
jgi:tRNA (guanine-N7-)-methyltransferase